MPKQKPQPSAARMSSQQTACLILLTVFVPPVGLWLIWRNPTEFGRGPRGLAMAWTAIFAWTLIYQNTPAGKREAAEQTAQHVAADKREAAIKATDKKREAAQQKVNLAIRVKEDAEATKEQKREQQQEAAKQDNWKIDFVQSRIAADDTYFVYVDFGSDDKHIIVGVDNQYFQEPYQLRLNEAQNLWRDWAKVRQSQWAKVTLVDVNDNVVGNADGIFGASINKE